MADDIKSDSGCQLQVVYESGTPLSVGDRVRNVCLRLESAVTRRMRRIFHRSATGEVNVPGSRIGISNSLADEKQTDLCRHLKIGDNVKVLPMDEIRATLDANGKCGGLAFMPGMGRFSGKKFTVMKRVRTIFDERAWRMVKVKDTVILRDVFCQGRDMFDKEGCDRCRFFF